MTRVLLRCPISGHLSRRARAFSMVEIMVVIGVVAVIAGIMIPAISNLIPSARETTSLANLEQLNQAVLRFNQANWELVLEADEGSEDEEAIARSLQYRGDRPAAGSPYLEPTLTIVSSDDTEIFRASWTGRAFTILAPGTAGSGLDLAGLHAGGTVFDFGENYQPVGAP